MPPWLTPAIAIYAAVISTATLVWNVLRAREARGRVRLKVTLEINFMKAVYPPEEEQAPELDDGTVLIAEAVNLGSELVRVVALSAIPGKGTRGRQYRITEDCSMAFGVESPELPWELDAKKRVRFRLHMRAYEPSYEGYFVEDTTGRKWKTSRRDMHRLHQDVVSYHVVRQRLEQEVRQERAAWDEKRRGASIAKPPDPAT